MPISDIEWREFTKDVRRFHSEVERFMAAQCEINERLELKLDAVVDKVDVNVVDIAVLKVNEGRRSTRDNATFGAAVVAVFGAVATVIGAVIRIGR